MREPEDVDDWYATHAHWPAEVALLRRIVRAHGLEETLRWRQPCYRDAGRNILIVSWRNAGAVLSFLKGALLEDPDGRLVQPGQAREGRYLCFSSCDQILAERGAIDAWIRGAVEVERLGLKLPPRADALELVEELRARMEADPVFGEAFEALTPGRQRGYNLHFGKAKQAATREAGIDRCTERILLGKGLQDCICGKSARMPRCDGSHKTA